MYHLHIGIDESGSFTKNESLYIFAGYICFTEVDYKQKVSKYKKYEKNNNSFEMKANEISEGKKKNIVYGFKNVYSFATEAKPNNLNGRLVGNKIGVRLYKDKILTNVIGEAIRNLTFKSDIMRISIAIDEQNLSVITKHNLYLELYQKLISGYYEKGIFYGPVLNDKVVLDIKYVDSKNYPLVRASDILANYLFNNLSKDTLKAVNVNVFLNSNNGNLLIN